jgi:DNA-directed RNA polymerase specialized sigma24 family protein
MHRKHELTETELQSLLSWLDPDPERAGHSYIRIRQGLVKIFVCRGCSEAEELADETINRVAARAEWLAENYDGKPMYYFIGVAKKIFLEYQRRRPSLVPLAVNTLKLPAPEPASELKFECLERCKRQLPETEREIIGHYYQTGVTAQQRADLADRLGVKLSNLRVRVFRLTSALEGCVNKCLESGDTA